MLECPRQKAYDKGNAGYAEADESHLEEALSLYQRITISTAAEPDGT